MFRYQLVVGGRVIATHAEVDDIDRVAVETLLRERADAAAVNGVPAVVYRFDMDGAPVSLIYATRLGSGLRDVGV